MSSGSNAPFMFLVRPVTTVNVSSVKLTNLFEDAMRSFLADAKFLSPISAILVLPGIIDSSVAAPPADYVGYQKRDNSVSVGACIDFTLWQRSTELERLARLADNIRNSLNKIQSRYLVDEDRQRLHVAVDKVQALLASRLLN
jgi:hypothetical protein